MVRKAAAARQIDLKKKAHALESSSFRKWRDEVIFELADGVKYTRRQITLLIESPSTRSATVLKDTCHEYNIRSLDRLYEIGHDSLARCERVGERTLLIAAYILAEHGYDIDLWTHMPEISLRSAIRLAYSRAKKHKH